MKITAKFREYENGAMKGFVDLTVNGSVGIKDARLVEGSNGLFISMPQVKVGEEEYRDVVTGVSKEFAALALDAALAARDSEEKKATIGESSDLFYDTHATALTESENAVKALASLTVRESKEAEKSAFTINGIRVLQGERNMFLGMPSVKTDSEEYPYNDLCYFTHGSENFLTGLIVSKAMDALGIEKKPKLDERVGEAKEKKEKAEPKAPKGSKKKEKEEERAE